MKAPRESAIALLLGAMLGCANPWDELEARYRTDDAPPAGVSSPSKVVLAATGYRGAFTFNYVVRHASDQGLYLAMSGPDGFTNEPVRVPSAVVSACTRICWDPGWDTSLWLEGARVYLSFPDNEGALLEWCKARGIPVVDDSAVQKKLYPDGSWGTR